MDTSWYLVQDILGSVPKSGHTLVQKLSQGYACIFLPGRSPQIFDDCAQIDINYGDN